MHSGNPTFTNAVLDDFRSHATLSDARMTVRGTAAKTMILLGLCVGTACFTWSMVWSAVAAQNLASVMPWAWGGVIGGLVFGVATAFVPRWAPVTAPLYALAEGLFLGALSAILEMNYPGIALQGTAATFGTLFSLLLAYQTGVIRATEQFKAGVIAATGGICLIYLISMVLRFFGMSIPLIHESGVIGIGFSVFVVIVAALNLVLDFDYIENASRSGAPKSMEWYGAYGLMVTLVWLYIEVLKLLMKLRSRD